MRSWRECLVMVESIKQFCPYLYGQEFTVVTDHKPLEHIHSFKSHNGRVARWDMALSDYHFHVIARPGRENANTDALSRLVANTIQKVENPEEHLGTQDPHIMQHK